MPEKITSDEVIRGLNVLLSDAAVLYYKLHNYHWFVTGPQFFTLHAEFERLYTAWAGIMDRLAERVLTVGGEPIGSLKAVLDNARLNDETERPSPEQMLDRVVADLRGTRDRMYRVIEHAEEANDRGTVNLLDEIRDGMEKDIWMLTAAARG